MSSTDEYFFLERENMPCVYELSWDGETPAIIVKVHKDFVRSCSISQRAPIVLSLMKEFGFSSFSGDLNRESFGFDGAFQRVGADGNFAIFKIVIPVVKKQSGQACDRCGGTGKDEFEFINGGKCLMCEGTGKETVFDWKSAYAISASLTVFFSVTSLKFNKKDKTSCSFPQLITVETATIKDMHGGSLWGVYSVPLANFLSSFQPDTEITEMTEAMVGVWQKMFGQVDKYEKYNFYAIVASENGWLNVNCPGDACGLHPADSMGCEPGRGYKFSCHNVDNPMQQIALISGLAALCDKARKEIPIKGGRL